MIICDEKVSVLMPTYNHKNYIARALNSILMQKTNFDFTIWIADDHSTDGTSEIIREIIHNNHNSRVTINHIISKQNLGIKNRVIHADNLLISDDLKNQYVACCHGDDYWINDQKLQQQYDILKANKEAISIGDSYISMEPDGIYLKQHRNIILNKNKALLDTRNPFSQTSTLMFKNIIDWNYFPDILHEDWGFIKIFNWYGENIFREICTTVYDRTSMGVCVTSIIPIKGMGQNINYLIYLLVRIIHYLKTDENLLLKEDHNFILTKMNKEWQFIDKYFVDDKILNFVEQYKTKRHNDDSPHYSTKMIFKALPTYKVIL